MGSSRKKEQHIAVFGESGSGKTVLVSSFLGATHEPAYVDRHHFRLVAEDVGQGQRLLQNYFKMRSSAEVPLANRFRAHTYRFALRLKEPEVDKSTKPMPFDAVSLVWHDYPGEWFEQDVSGPEEARRRVETFRSLLVSDVALLLVDGQKLLENAGNEERYLKALFANFSNGLLALRDDLLDDGKRLVVFPRIWTVALSKADLMPDMTASDFETLVIEKAADSLAALRETISGMVQASDALSVGEDFIILSSAKFDGESIRVEERIGLELLLPLAAILPFERHVSWAQKKELPGKVAQRLLGKSEVIGAAAVAAALLGVKATKLPGPFGKVTAIVSTFASKDTMTEAASLVGEKLREANRKAVEKRHVLTAILTQFKIDLERGEDEGILSRSHG